jgi:hypothetical protein
MKTQSNNIPKLIFDLGNGNSHFNYGIEQITNSDPMGVNTIGYQFNSVEVAGQVTTDTIIEAIIKDKYSFQSEIAIINNYNSDKNVDEYMQYQQFRELAKWIAKQSNLLTAQEIETQNATLKKIKITTPLAKLVDGGIYAQLADMLIKTKAIHTTVNDTVVVYLAYILPEHLAILQKDSQVKIEL